MVINIYLLKLLFNVNPVNQFYLIIINQMVFVFIHTITVNFVYLFKLRAFVMF